MLQLWACPTAIPTCSAVAGDGMFSWPLELLPQHPTPPAEFTEQVCRAGALEAIATCPVAAQPGTLVCENVESPQHVTAPPEDSEHVCVCPAVIATCADVANAGTLVWPGG